MQGSLDALAPVVNSGSAVIAVAFIAGVICFVSIPFSIFKFV